MRSKVFLLSLMALSLAFTACNKKQDEPKSETDATISVAVQSDALRAYEDGEGSEDMKVKSLAVMVYQGEAQVAYKEAEQGSLEVKDIETTAGVKTIVVVANFANKTLKGLSLSKIKALTHELAANDQDPAKGTLMLTAEPVQVTLVKGKNAYGYEDQEGVKNLSKEPLKLKHIHAGMSLKSVEVKFASSYSTLYNVKFDNGAVIGLIAKKQSNIFGTPLANTDMNYLYGQSLPGMTEGKYTPANYNLLAELAISVQKHEDIVKTDLKGFGFYILENNNAKHPTILCLKGKLTQADGADLTNEQAKQAKEAGWIVSETDHSTYYPVLVNWTKDGYSYGDSHNATNAIVRNNKYQISLTITGPGTNSPEDPTAEKANLDVKCEVEPWTIVAQNVVW